MGKGKSPTAKAMGRIELNLAIINRLRRRDGFSLPITGSPIRNRRSPVDGPPVLGLLFIRFIWAEIMVGGRPESRFLASRALSDPPIVYLFPLIADNRTNKLKLSYLKRRISRIPSTLSTRPNPTKYPKTP
jgi:hypothetical protein